MNNIWELEDGKAGILVLEKEVELLKQTCSTNYNFICSLRIEKIKKTLLKIFFFYKGLTYYGIFPSVLT